MISKEQINSKLLLGLFSILSIIVIVLLRPTSIDYNPQS